MNRILDESTSIAKIKAKIAEVAKLRTLPRHCPEYMKWYRETTVLLEKIFGSDANQVGHFHAIQFTYHGGSRSGDHTPFERRYRSALEEAVAILTSIYEEIEEFGIPVAVSSVEDPISLVEKIALQFHAVARQLRARHAGRQTLDVADEYDASSLQDTNMFRIRPRWLDRESGGGHCGHRER